MWKEHRFSAAPRPISLKVDRRVRSGVIPDARRGGRFPARAPRNARPTQDEDGVSAIDACKSTCGECESTCADSTSWYFKRSKWDCAKRRGLGSLDARRGPSSRRASRRFLPGDYISKKTDSRCADDKVDDDGVSSLEACPSTCGTC